MDGELTLGLVLTLDGDLAARGRLLDALAMREDVSLAPVNGHRLPVAVQTRAGEDRTVLAALQDLPGVVFCDVVYAHFDEYEEAP